MELLQNLFCRIFISVSLLIQKAWRLLHILQNIKYGIQKTPNSYYIWKIIHEIKKKKALIRKIRWDRVHHHRDLIWLSMISDTSSLLNWFLKLLELFAVTAEWDKSIQTDARRSVRSGCDERANIGGNRVFEYDFCRNLLTTALLNAPFTLWYYCYCYCAM